ncbi:NADH-ubiquinone oxidoreductase chain [Trifolium pratense]|uniref:NADH-ubiquinone oxidoreductase chain n=1 Tax=Trifolium pratense TaxID=57577 RepID=A0A2K3K0G5_TRIPR|nr:NADH-ubiquinone oxidoreductase chain [Trifolium pratense]
MRSNRLTGQAVVLKGNLARKIQQTRDRDKASLSCKWSQANDLVRSPFTKKFTCPATDLKQSVADSAKKVWLTLP